MTGRAIPVFVGPSLPPAARPLDSLFDWHPPASAGDLLGLLPRPPARLCLIDGFFDSRPAPWHKELLLLMARGTLVFGAASMGALRAAELHRFGMIGIGTIFRAYRDGRLSGDDEVALVHAPERLGWAPLTVPMVEVRATLISACRARLLSANVARRIRTALHEIHFDARDWPMMEKACLSGRLIDKRTFRRFQSLHVQLKRADAMACLAAARVPARAVTVPEPPGTCFMRELARQLGLEIGESRAMPRRHRRKSACPARQAAGDGA